MLVTQQVHGHPIVGFVFMEMQGARATGYIVVDRGEGCIGKQRYVSAWYRDGDREWSSGHYTDSRQDAIWEMTMRAVGPQLMR